MAKSEEGSAQNGELPSRLMPLYVMTSVNESILLGKDRISFEFRHAQQECEADVELAFLPRPNLSWVIRQEQLPPKKYLHFAFLEDFGNLVDMQGEKYEAFASQIKDERVSITPCTQRLRIGKQESRLKRVVFHLTNFPDFRGPNNLIYTSKGRSEVLGCAILCADEWRVRFHLIPETRAQHKEARSIGGYFIGHVGQIEKNDGSAFSASEAESLLDALHYFLSFAAGRWVAPAFPIGFDESDNPVWKIWGLQRCDPSVSSITWFDESDGHLLEQTFPCFMNRWIDPNWHDAIESACYWYLAANNQENGLDVRLALLQTALESLAWIYCVEHRKLVTRKGFDQLRASDQMRMLLSSLYIPITIPNELRDMSRMSRALGWKDGPHAITEIRNAIVHADRNRGRKHQEAYADSWKLGMWYIEMALLHILNHNGEYGNRLRPRYEGHLDRVPWAETQTRSDT